MLFYPGFWPALTNMFTIDTFCPRHTFIFTPRAAAKSCCGELFNHLAFTRVPQPEVEMYRVFKLFVFKLFPLLLLAVLFGCAEDGGPSGGPPQITGFTASPTSVASGAPVTLSWVITGSPTSLSIDNGVGEVTGNNRVVNPTVTTTYTLTASNGSSNDTKSVVVTVDGTVPPPGGTKTVSFGVSNTQGGPFTSDADSSITSATDDRVVNVPSSGGTFYASVSYSGPAPVTGVTIYIANRSPAGLMADLVTDTNVKGFTLGEAVGECSTGGTQTSVTCIYPITAAPGTPNITGLEGASGEFAYVFRTRISDTSGGDPYNQPPRGYVTVGSGGTTPPPPIPDPDPDPPTDNQDPVAAFTSTQTASDTTGVTYKFSALDSDDPDGDTLTYAWDFGDGSEATTRDFTKKYTSSNDYEVTLTVTDGKGGLDTETKTLSVTVPGSPPVPATYILRVNQTGRGNVTAKATAKGSKCESGPNSGCTVYPANTAVVLTAVEVNSTFVEWGGVCSAAGTAETCELTMDADKVVAITFTTR